MFLQIKYYTLQHFKVFLSENSNAQKSQMM